MSDRKHAKPTGRTYWQSFEHLAESPDIAEAVDKEFAAYNPDDVRQAPSRRKFLKYAAASMSLSGIGLSGCRRWPTEVIAPYAHAPNDHIPGVPDYFASSWELGGVGQGVVVESFDNRPIKIEGNPFHPGSRTRSFDPAKPKQGWGATNIFAQAQTLSLYDPERSRGIVNFSGRAPVAETSDVFDRSVLPRLAEALAGNRLAVLAEATASPTMLRLLEQLPAGSWYTWDPLVPEAATQAARPTYKLDQAKVLVSLDDDYLGNHPAQTRHASDWAAARAAADNESSPRMLKTYQIECRHSLTGTNADRRLPCRPSDLAVISEALLAAVSGQSVELVDDRAREFVEAAAADLLAAKGDALVVAGSHAPAAVRAVAAKLNDTLGSVGRTIEYIENPMRVGKGIAELASAVKGGQVEGLIILGGNPVYDAPADVDFVSLLGNIATSVHLSPYIDETSRLCSVHVPRAHFLECWGDTRGWDGTYAPQQPLILPLFDGVSPIEMLAKVLGLETTDGYALVVETFNSLAGDGGDFRKFLHDGVLAESAAKAVAAPAVDAGSEALLAVDGLEVVFQGDSTLYDGRFANSGWLQEVPDPLTKLTWDNAAMMSVKDANDRDLRTGDMITLAVGGRSVDIAVYVLPGQPNGVIGLPLGYGRTAGGSLANANLGDGGGFDTYRLRTSDGLYYATGATVKKMGERYVLAMTQNHHLIDDTGYEGRVKRVGEKGGDGKIIRETTFDDHAAYLDKVAHGKKATHPTKKYYDYAGITLQIFQPPSEFNYPHAWGMTVDMSACIGCSACVVACQSENNIPVVGKESVLNNREMHWLRIDRYFKAQAKPSPR